MLNLWPQLETRRTTLRRVTDQDLDFVFDHFRDPKVSLYLVDADPPASPKEARDIINWCNGNGNSDSRQNRWLIVFKETGEPIGTVGFHNWDRTNRIAEVGYDLAAAYWGKGIMGEVLQRVLGFAFDEMQVNRVQAYVHLENAKSYRVLKKIGFVAEGVIRDRHFFQGAYHDHYLLALLRRDFYDSRGATL